MSKNEQKLIKQLGDLMSAVSESCYCAKELVEISIALGGWVNLNEAASAYEKFEPIPIPDEYLKILDREFEFE